MFRRNRKQLRHNADNGVQLNIHINLLEREMFWDTLFRKYSKEFEDDIELDITQFRSKEEASERYFARSQVPVRKSARSVQSWIDTGNVSYTPLVGENEYLSNNQVLSGERILDLPICPVRDTERISHGNQFIQNSNSSCSSVDTAAYILSNTNKVKKPKATAFVEGLQSFHFESLKPPKIARNTVQVKHTSKKIFQTEMEKPIIQKTNTSENDTMAVQTISQANVSSRESVGHEMKLTDIGSTPCKTTKQYSDSFIRKEDINNVATDCPSRTENAVSENEFELTNMMSQNIKRSFLEGESCTFLDSTTKSLRRKKLYSNRDSPVDITLIKSERGSRLSQPRQNLHPALDSPLTGNMSKLKNVRKHRNRRKMTFNLFNKSFTNPRRNHSIIEKNVSKRNKKLCNVSKSSNKFITNVNTSSVEQHEFKKPFAVTKTKQYSTNMNPVICLKKLSVYDIQKYQTVSNGKKVRKKPLYKSTPLKNTFIENTTRNLRKHTRGNNLSESSKSKDGKIPLRSKKIFIDSDVDSESSMLFFECKHEFSDNYTFTRSSVSTENVNQDASQNIASESCITEPLRSNKESNYARGRLKENNLSKQLRTNKSEIRGCTKNNNQAIKISHKEKILEKIKNDEVQVKLERLPIQNFRSLKNNLKNTNESTAHDNTFEKINVQNEILKDDVKNVNTDKNSRSSYARVARQKPTNNKKTCVPSQSISEPSDTLNNQNADTSKATLAKTHTSKVLLHDIFKKRPSVSLSSDEEDEFVKFIQHFQCKKKSRLSSNCSKMTEKRENRLKESDASDTEQVESIANKKLLRGKRSTHVTRSSTNGRTLSMLSPNNNVKSLYIKKLNNTLTNEEAGLDNRKSRNSISRSLEKHFGRHVKARDPNLSPYLNKNKHLDAAHSTKSNCDDINRLKDTRNSVNHVESSVSSNIMFKKTRSNVNQLCFQTKVIDSD